MRNIFLTLIVAAGVATALSSCDSKNRLAGQMEGEWTSMQETLPDAAAAECTMLENYAFIKPDSKMAGGTFVITSMIEVTMAPPFNGQAVETVSQGIAAQATVEGQWTVVDDDDVAMNFDLTTLTVNVDSTAVDLRQNLMSGAEAPMAGSVDSTLVAPITAALRSALRSKYMTMRILEDVKVENNSVMKFEVGKTDYVLTRAM